MGSGLRRTFRWPAYGIADRIGSTMVDVVTFMNSARAFSSAVSEYLTALSSVEILYGQLVTGCALDGSGNFAAFRHGLGRAYRGAIVVNQTRTAVFIRVLQPADPQLATMGVTSSTHFAVRPTGFGEPNLSCSFDAWCF